MIPKPIEAITTADIQSLIDNQVAENRSMEYKEALPGNSDDEKKEFLADLSSFANAGGGDIIYGLVESEGLPVRVKGIENDIDAEILRLENITRDGLDPRVPGVSFTPIAGFPEGPILLVRVPESWIAPHLIKYKKWSRFYTRNSAGKYQMDITEIRSAFLRSQEVPERVRRFRDLRLGKIVAGEAPIASTGKGKMIMHILPFVSFSTNYQLSVLEIEKHWIEFLQMGGGGGNHRFNLDGVLTFSGSADSYCQFFRNGCLEAVYAELLSQSDSNIFLPSVEYERLAMDALCRYLSAMMALEIPFPVYLFLSLHNVKGSLLGVTPQLSFRRGHLPMDRATIITPEVEILEAIKNLDLNAAAEILKPIFDAVWNAYGYGFSHNYDKEGVWVSQERLYR